MPQKKLWLVVSFAATTEALRAEKIFLGAGIKGALIPTPRSISSSCGLCFRTVPESRPAVEQQLKEQGLRTESLLEMLM